MGTSGAFGFVCDNEVKMTYNHFDSYPTGLGVDMAQAVVSIRDDVEKAKKNVRAIELVDPNSAPSQDLIDEYKSLSNLQVGEKKIDDWYCLLREVQGEPSYWLDGSVRHMTDYIDFANDSLFCEWAYLINLDTEELEIYVGFQEEEHNLGRFANTEPLFRLSASGDKYYPIALIETLSFQEIPKNRKYIQAIMQEIENGVYADDN